MLNYTQFINEKFDYTKQKTIKPKSLFDSKEDDVVYIDYVDNNHKLTRVVKKVTSLQKEKMTKSSYLLRYNDGKYTKFSTLYTKDSINLNYPIFPGLYFHGLYNNNNTTLYCLVSTSENLLDDFEKSHDMIGFLFQNSMKADIKLVEDFLEK